MKPTLIDLFVQAQKAHEYIYSQSLDIQENLEDQNLAELTDTAYACRETIKFLEDARKAITKLKENAELRACIEWMQEAQESGEQSRIRTKYCTAQPKISMIAKVPTKKRYNPEQYQEIMSALGVSQDLIDKEALRLNWEGFTEWNSEQQSNGKPMLKGIKTEDTYPKYELSIRKLHGVDEEV